MLKQEIKLAILVSGYGSNLQAIIDAIEIRKLTANIKVVISDKAEAHALTRAKKHHLATETLLAKNFSSRENYDQALIECLNQYQPDLIILAGFMRILSRSVIEAYKHRILNIHPALLPNYRGLNTHQRVLDAGETIHGSTVHLVTEDLDAGPILAQAKLEISPNDNIESLKKRIQSLEHQLYPKVIQWFAEEKINIKNEKIYLDGHLLPPQGYQLNSNRQQL